MNENVNESMGAIIARKRKELGLTQEQLAGELGISYQAVSKWENELSSPDISTLPLLADLFDITIDELFGRVPAAARVPEQALVPAAEPVRSAGVELPWEDDDTLRAVLFEGHRLVGHEDASFCPVAGKIVLRYAGDALDVQSSFDVHVEGNVCGSASAQGDVSCGAVGGPVSAGGDVNCGDVGGPVSAGGDVNCGSVAGGAVDDGEFRSNLKGKKRGFSFERKL